MKKILIIGATSAIAAATARRYAASGARFCLLGRDPERLAALAADLRVRGASEVDHDTFVAEDLERHPAMLRQAIDLMGGFDLALIAHGVLSDQATCEHDTAALLDTFDINTLSVLVMLTELANHAEQVRYGTIAVISSVAGDRGRQSNYVYGASKAAIDVFMSGLRNRLHRSGVAVITIKPGFVRTPMTADLAQGALWAEPDTIAKGIVRAVSKRRNVVYLPGWWRPIMSLIRHLPEALFKRLKL